MNELTQTQHFLALTEDSPVAAILRLKRQATTGASEWVYKQMQKIADRTGLDLNAVLDGRVTDANWKQFQDAEEA